VSSPHLGVKVRFFYCQAVAGLLLWGTFSDERAGLSFTIAVGPRQRSHSRVRVRGAYDHILLSQILDSPSLEGQVPQEQGDPVIPPGTGFRFSRLLRLVGRRWRYSTSPPHGEPTVKLLVLVIEPRRGPHKKRFFHYCLFSRFQGNNASTELFPSKGCSTITCLHSSYLTMGLHMPPALTINNSLFCPHSVFVLFI
jgi:hypothetical protein